MSAEKIISSEETTLMTGKASVVNEKNSRTVDINNLIARVRIEKQKENKVNLIFFGLFVALIFLIIIIISY
jgi:hypothetical protein